MKGQLKQEAYHVPNLLVSLLTIAAVTPTHQYTPSNIFIGGLGYVGSRLASAIHEAYPAANISGTVRSIQRREGLLNSSSRPSWLTGDAHVLDVDDEYIGLDSKGLRDLMAADTIIQTVAPIADFGRDPILAFHYEQLASSSALKYVAYISSTGVYGDHGGNWVSEEDELKCTDAKSLARIQAEMDWGKLESASEEISEQINVDVAPRVDCFRCGGIYGPGRGPLFSSMESLTEAIQSKVETGGDNNTHVKYVNRILVDDICSAILSGICGSRPFNSGGRAYNLVDNDPVPRMAVVREARRLLLGTSHDDADGEVVTALSPPSSIASRNVRERISRGTGNKRCTNDRLKSDYGWTPTAPTFREGLASLLLDRELS
jgi:nucleoside-diphosphate-sugar epimerase